MKKSLKAKCERIAKEAGADLTWIKGEYGYYIPGTNKIHVGCTGSERSIVTIFSHELAHYKNFLSGKYYKYHHLKGRAFMRKFKTKDAIIKYSLKAEIYTDKVGKKLAAEYFPGVKYKKTYKMNKAFYDQMYNKYFGQFIVILIDDKDPKIILDNFNYLLDFY